MKKIIKIAMLILIPLILSSCLTTEYKEYRFTLNKDGSGTGVIKYINIVSQEDEETDVSFTDFNELIDDYLNGSTFEDENSSYTVTNKRLFEENGVLCAEIEFSFDRFEDIPLKVFDCKCSPMLLYMGSFSETFKESNGDYLSTDDFDFPLISWENGTKELYYKTIVTEDLSDSHSLLPIYEQWAKDN